MSSERRYLLAFYLQSNKLLLLCISVGRANWKAPKLLLKCHSIMSNRGLYVNVSKKKYLVFLVLLWYCLINWFSSAMKIWLFLLPPLYNHLPPVGSWLLPSSRCLSQPTYPRFSCSYWYSAGLMEKAGLFSQVGCQHNRKTKLTMTVLSITFDNFLIGRGKGNENSLPSTWNYRILLIVFSIIKWRVCRSSFNPWG